MIKLYIDSDIILDLLVKRNDYDNAAELMTKTNKKNTRAILLHLPLRIFTTL